MAWLLPLAIIAHIIEEFVFPGGFIKWYRDYKPEIASSITTSRLTLINLVLVIASFIPLFFGTCTQGISWLLAITSILAVNAIFHVVGSGRTKTYSPGEITAVFLYLPFAIFVNWHLLATQAITWDYAAQCFLVGIGYHIWSAYAHRQRAMKFEQYQSAGK
ncbi:HXXEE domain-containing protein [Mucilaginibacter agri]|uniref:HXXEE domain-containing protein n=1 Tax=Mucilaginibacter agri TaxID=2695265 RepID=A0A965ZEZ7_9SPHI|nr:HXXEE domain-containing protein [Mucilaginibacter agri]NCD69500.1 HXXEE domain-containing protein [Mucilaginibacter agri]